MSVVVDVNSISSVFSEGDENHKDFLPVFDYITNGGGAMVAGGEKYKRELFTLRRYNKIFLELRRQNRLVYIDDDVVNTIENHVIEKTAGTNCNDQHIIALLSASSCGILCTKDIRMHKYVKNKSLYPKNSRKVRIYSSIRCISILRRWATPPSSLKNVIV
jgi:hypothetical protein